MWYHIKNINETDSPALIVYPARIKQNIDTAIGMVGDTERLRPHVKTNKCAEVALLMQEAGIRKFKCATIAEAEMLAITGAQDVLLAYQPVGPKLERFIQIISKYPGTKWSCLVDNIASARGMDNAFAKHAYQVPVYIDLNLGMNRTGVVPDKATELYKELAELPALETVGLHVYDGHLTHPDITLRTEQCNAAFDKVNALKDKLTALGMNDPVVIAGGSPSFPIHAKRTDVECSPGTFVYWDQSYLTNCPEQPFVPAAVLITRVISNPAPGIVCTDLGHKSVSAENPVASRVSILDDHDLVPLGQSEEHLILTTTNQNAYPAGTVLYALPFHVCPTVALYEKVHVAENGLVSGSWKNIARDRYITC